VTIDDINDRIAICETKARYCRFLDTKQWDAWTSLFTEDLVMDTSEAGGPPPIKGRDEAVASVRAVIETARTAHHVHTPEVVIEGDAARVIWAMQDRVLFDNGQGFIGFGHYAETYAKRNGEWRISSLKLTRLHIDPVADAAGGRP
jgi:hypothetical protein